MQSAPGEMLIIGGIGGIGGFTLALSLHAVGLGDRVRIFDAVSDIKPVERRRVSSKASFPEELIDMSHAAARKLGAYKKP